MDSVDDVIGFCRELNRFVLEVKIGKGCPQASSHHSQQVELFNRGFHVEGRVSHSSSVPLLKAPAINMDGGWGAGGTGPCLTEETL